MAQNPFGDDEARPEPPANPFGEETPASENPAEAARSIEHAAARIRRLKSQIGAEGLTLSATRELLDQLTAALDATARALRSLP